jgi:peptidoglycan/LPS O-acetylase OafA/YrhL
MSYTDLMEELGIVSTGMLNYHLKILGELLTKDETGHYMLTEKGRLASRLLLEFPETSPKENHGKPKWWRRFWIGAFFFIGVSLIVSFAAYFSGYTDLAGLYRELLTIAGAVGIAYMIAHITRDILSKEKQLLLGKITYTLLGVFLGSIVSFFAAALLILASRYLGGPDLGHIEGGGELSIFATMVLMILGGVWGYRVGKKRGFQKPRWAI